VKEKIISPEGKEEERKRRKQYEQQTQKK